MNILNLVEKFFLGEYRASNLNSFRLYGTSNENINGYLDFFNLTNRSLCTIDSSFDHYINASFKNPRSVTIVDKCPFTEYYSYLKLAAFLELHRMDYAYFICKKDCNQYLDINKKFMLKETFERIKNTLRLCDYDSYCIWEEIFCRYNQPQINSLFRDDVTYLENVIRCNCYLLSDVNYLLARKSVLNTPISIIIADINDFGFNIGSNVVWLSNVFDYLKNDEIIFKRIVNGLSNGGEVLYRYYWEEDFIVADKLRMYALEFDTKCYNIVGARSCEKGDDFVLIYTK